MVYFFSAVVLKYNQGQFFLVCVDATGFNVYSDYFISYQFLSGHPPLPLLFDTQA